MNKKLFTKIFSILFSIWVLIRENTWGNLKGVKIENIISTSAGLLIGSVNPKDKSKRWGSLYNFRINLQYASKTSLYINKNRI